MKKTFLFTILFFLISFLFYAQKPSKLSSNQIYEKIQKLNFLGTALYIAAHPDDENTRLISYLSNHIKARTGYLSLTRGDGGQNLIGPEISELLGVIRTQELLAARNIDGGEQFFTRANDFGYSKHPDETFEIWDKDKVLSDVVWLIRTFKPDIIINRFNHKTPGSTHGHHTSSAMLSVKAFDLAADENQFKDQLKFTKTWRPKRLFFNTSSWFYKNSDDFENATKELSKLDVGVYYPLKGLSNNEIAAIASSQHLCQGFGRLSSRGSENDYLEFLKGDSIKDKNDIFSGINTTWNRVEGGKEIGEILYEIEKNFDFINPSKHLPKLLEAYQKVQLLDDKYWREIKENQLLDIIEACAGLYLEVSAESSSGNPNEKISVNFELINRSTIPVQLTSIKNIIEDKIIFKGLDLNQNKKLNFKESLVLKTSNFSTPYWLKNEATLGLYSVDNQQLIGKPETPREIAIQFNLVINFTPITITKNVIRRYAESDKGEIYEPFEVLPKVTTKLIEKVLIFSDSIARKINVEVKAGANYINGMVELKVPENWSVEPKFQNFNIQQKKDKQIVEFLVHPPKNQSEGKLEVIATLNEETFNKELVEINYNHIPKQSVLLNSEAKIVRLNIKTSGNFIGYIKGAGDAIPESLRQIGYKVEEINPTEINEENLKKYDAIVLGIRVYNVVDELKFKQKYLLKYVEYGGNLIVQYNTNRGVEIGAPYPLKLSSDRVTDEFSEVIILDETHEILNFPNKITQEDFKGWIQERGLYFPNSWNSEYKPILSMNDKGETPKKGSLLVAKFGKGNYVYTGLSFFRELPAGVAGAYKLFANILSLPKNSEEKIEEKN
ncbi:MAG: LmbE family protein [Flavobacteriia bacterium]|nr:LmbE family protein [Flavobacteriia bacterium]OIP47219.1 MAG: LmbE family protein [Flavobacteriaceae bacterium CG2_30_31_66]PIV96016.1 MAG: LmbE family protein [Flavobacteriaceae bacterium CG17_big_fil_post_rev_8_21_14_2_50_31_13]PIX11912.1 MAG: LmbE family protein [Flavobacteriaceae bacterium CG_4_8_14_3_um_filter_31_8]PIY13928.1 MAG: LmbE family protein [Flavobacteriaceae bacterium CG_4_10_14_3_um_filter_31_253]PIZ10970.1 MAG: LmbE family protein [Flavobacteriaceae bacterium CG_4_10_14_0_